jgi:organic radical activating enzyme
MQDDELSDTFKEVTPMYVANAHYDTVSITGGEPTLDMHRLLMFVSLIKYRKPDTIVYVYTNGDLLTREEADMMKVAGVDGINWSPHIQPDNYAKNKWAFIHHCVIPVRVRVQDTLFTDDLRKYFNNQNMEFVTWSIGDCYNMPEEDRYRLKWRDQNDKI